MRQVVSWMVTDPRVYVTCVETRVAQNSAIVRFQMTFPGGSLMKYLFKGYCVLCVPLINLIKMHNITNP